MIVDESILFSLGFLSQNSLLKLSLNRWYERIYVVGWEGMWKVIFWKTGCSRAFGTSHQLNKRKKKSNCWFPCAPHQTQLPMTQSTPTFLSLAGHFHSCSPFFFFFNQHNTHTHTPLPHPPTGTFLIITSTVFSGKTTRKSFRTSHLHISYLRLLTQRCVIEEETEALGVKHLCRPPSDK